MRILVLILLLTQLSLGQDIYVNNKPFKGKSQGQGRELYLQVSTFLKLLKLESLPDQLATKMIGEVKMIRLTDAAEVLNLRVIRNTDLGTIDVYRGKEAGSVTNTGFGDPSSSAANTPEEAVRSYFKMLRQISEKYDFTDPSHFDAYLAAHKPIITAACYQEHSQAISRVKSKGMSSLFDSQLDRMSSAQCKILGSKINGTEATVETKIKLTGMRGKEENTFTCFLEGGRWRVDPGF